MPCVLVPAIFCSEAPEPAALLSVATLPPPRTIRLGRRHKDAASREFSRWPPVAQTDATVP